MKRIAFAVVLMALAVPSFAPARQLRPAMKPLTAEKFAETAAYDNTAEIRAGQMALQKTSNAGVKDLAQLIVNDHTKAGDELAALAQKKNLKLPEGVDSKAQMMLDRLQSLPDARFDRAFAKEMVKDHRKAVKLFKSYAQYGPDADLQQFARQTLPKLEEHLRKAEDLQRLGPAEASTRG